MGLAEDQGAAQPGQILVSRTAYRLAQEAFTFEALESISGNDVDFAALLELEARASGLTLEPEDVEVDDGLGPIDPTANGGGPSKAPAPL